MAVRSSVIVPGTTPPRPMRTILRMRHERAIAFYRKNGFVQIAERRFQVGSHTYDDIVLSRALEP
jgi:hypothetical protein